MLYILYGEDDFSLRQSLEEIKKEMGNPEFLAANTTVVDGREVTLNQLLNLCSAAPFLSEKRLVIVENLLSRFEPKPEAKRRGRQSALNSKRKEAEEWKALSRYIEQMPVTTVLLLIDGKLNEGNVILRTLSSLAKVMTFPVLKGKQLRDWIKMHAARGGVSISTQAISLLAEAVGGDLWTMDREMEKLVVYCRGRAIKEEDVRELVSHAREPNILSLVDAILETRVQVAQQLLHQLLKEGVTSSDLLVKVANQLSFIVRAKELPKGLSREEAKKALGLVKDYPFDKTLAQAESYTLERIREVYHKLVETDLAIKTGKYDDDLALDLLIMELCQLQKIR